MVGGEDGGPVGEVGGGLDEIVGAGVAGDVEGDLPIGDFSSGCLEFLLLHNFQINLKLIARPRLTREPLFCCNLLAF